MIGSTIAKILVEAKAEVTIVDALLEPFGAILFNIDKIKDKVNLNILKLSFCDNEKGGRRKRCYFESC